MGEVAGVLDEFFSAYPFIGSVLASLVGTMLFESGRQALANSRWSRDAPVDHDIAFIDQSDRAIRRIVAAPQYVEENRSNAIALYLIGFIAILAAGWFASWRLPISLPILFYGLVFYAVSLIVLVEAYYAESVMVFAVASGLLFGGLGVALNSDDLLGTGLLCFGIGVLVQAISTASGEIFGVNIGAFAEEIHGHSIHGRIAGALRIFAFSLAGVGWGLSFLIDASDKGGFGLMGLGLGFVASSATGLTEIGPRAEEKQLRRPTRAIAVESASTLLFGAAAIAWAVGLFADSDVALQICLVALGAATSILGVRSLIYRKIGGVVWLGLSGGFYIFAVARIVDQSWAPILVALCSLFVATIAASFALWGERWRVDEVAAHLGQLRVTLILKDSDDHLIGLVSWDDDWGRSVSESAADLQRVDAKTNGENRPRIYETRILTAPELPSGSSPTAAAQSFARPEPESAE